MDQGGARPLYIYRHNNFLVIKSLVVAKSLVAELVPLHVQSVWESRGERIRVTELAACCNYFSKKIKINKKEPYSLTSWHYLMLDIYSSNLHFFLPVITI